MTCLHLSTHRSISVSVSSIERNAVAICISSFTRNTKKTFMAALQWRGVFPALLTPFTEDDKIDFSLFEKNLRCQVEAGVDGVIIGGSLGEASTLTNEEKTELLLFAKDILPSHVPVVVNIAEQATKEAVRLAGVAENAGAGGLMLLPPMRYAADENETVQFFKSVSRNTGLPIMLYNNPVDYKIPITLKMFAELAGEKNITAVKESSRDIINVTRMINEFGDRYKILCGVDPLAFESLCAGADGWVAGLVDAFPKETVAIYRLVKAGRLQEALKIYRWFMPLLELDIHPKLVQYIKLAATATGIGSEHVRPPRLPLSGSERIKVEAVIQKALAARPELSDYLSLKFSADA